MGIVMADIAAITNNTDVEAITWEKLEAACQVSSQYQLLHKTVNQGVSNNSQDWDMQIKDYFVHRHALSTLGSVVLLYDRPVIPQALRHDILQHLHAGHAGCNMMFSRASSCLYWPHYREDINKFQASCKTCRLILGVL